MSPPQPPRSSYGLILARVAATATVGGSQGVVVTLREGPLMLWPFHWPTRMFDEALGDNNRRERSGKTAKGTPWTYSESNSADNCDDDSTYVSE